MYEPLDEQYIKWLYQQVASVRLRNPNRTYWSLIRQLFTKEYIWFVPNDDNRVEDGRDLRYEFIEKTGIHPDAGWVDIGCSMLEMLIALARRLSFEAEGSPKDWFWILIENLDIRDHNDAYYNGRDNLKDVDDILDRVIWRTYHFDGTGGLFPLKYPPEDQRETELWYQLSHYLLERV